MADKKISALTGATTPLAGTEVLPIVQSGSTVKVAVSDLTAGRTMSAASLGVGTTTPAYLVDITKSDDAVVTTAVTNASAGTSAQAQLRLNNSLATLGVLGHTGGSFTTSGVFRQDATYIYGTGGGGISLITGANVPIYFAVNFNEVARLTTAGNLAISNAGNGIDFSANTNAPGMTSELLNWYEEGTFTPNQGGGLVVVGAFSSSGRYVRYGNMITVQVFLQGATSIAWASGAAILFTNLPFTAKTGFECTGVGHSSNYTTSFSVLTAGTNTVFSVEAQGAVANVSITLTYFV